MMPYLSPRQEQERNKFRKLGLAVLAHALSEWRDEMGKDALIALMKKHSGGDDKVFLQSVIFLSASIRPTLNAGDSLPRPEALPVSDEPSSSGVMPLPTASA
jgi:hypothetical protein